MLDSNVCDNIISRDCIFARDLFTLHVHSVVSTVDTHIKQFITVLFFAFVIDLCSYCVPTAGIIQNSCPNFGS